MYKYYKYAVITVIYCISAASFASSNIQKTTNNFNFKNLSAQKNYDALDYGVYEPAKAIAFCNNGLNNIPPGVIWPEDGLNNIPPGGIWPEDSNNPFPSPEPTITDCEISAQIAYGCNYDSAIGRALTKSVVGIMIRDTRDSDWYLTCTGTIIDNQWVLTAAHCLVDKDTREFKGALVVPWQKLKIPGWFGVPVGFRQEVLDTYETIKVRSVNILALYDGPLVRSYSPDLALLKIDPIKPNMGLEPIPVANTSSLNGPETPVIIAGYGRTEEQGQDGRLRYRKSYYMTNIYDGSWRGGLSKNYGNIYTLDSKPIDYKGVTSAWSFTGPGDSGSPILSYNPLTHKFQIEGVHSGSMFCNYAGYFAKLPYPYSKEASTTYPENYDFIQSVVNSTFDPSIVVCFGECRFRNLHVINQTDNNISSYSVDGNNNLLLGSKIPTGNYPTQIAFNQFGNVEFVTNFISNSVYINKINFEGGLVKTKIFDLPDKSGPVDIAYLPSDQQILFDQQIAVLARNSNSLLQYSYDYSRLSFVKSYPTVKNPTHLNFITFDQPDVKDRYLLITNEEGGIITYKWDNAIHALLNPYTTQLTKVGEKLIEIKQSGEDNNPKLYVLTTQGVYIYQLNIIDKHLTFTLVGSLFSHFALDSHLVPLYENSFAVSNRFSTNNVILYEVSPDNKIAFKNDLAVPEPGAMAFDNGILYIISSSTRSLYSYRISYPYLSVSSKPQIVETGNGATIVKVNVQSY